MGIRRNRGLGLKILVLLLAAPAVWFGGLWLYSLRPVPPMPQPSGQVKVWSTAEWSHIPAEGERCILANNVWNKRAASSGFQQEVFVEDLDGKRTLGWRWRSPWQMQTSIAAYPELICGNKPWDEPIGKFEGLPFHPGEKSLTADYDIRLQAVGTYNMAFSLWAVSALPPSPKTIRCEVMIWIAQSGQKPSGTRRGSLVVDGVVYDTWINEHQHDMSGTNPAEWTYVAFVAETPVLHGPLDITPFLDALAPLKVLTPDLWITDVELGNEVAEGSGMAEVQDFALHVADRTTAPVPLTPSEIPQRTDD